MTLVELLVVLLLIAGALAGVSGFLGLLGANALRKAGFKLTNAIEGTFGRAAINGTRYQLVIDLDANEYWAECTEEEVAIGAMMVGPAANGNDRYEEDDPDGELFEYSFQNTFDDCSEPIIPRTQLHEDLEFLRVMTTHQEEPFLSGRATIAFFPSGFVEQSIIWLAEKDTEHVLTMFIQPLTGQVRVEVGNLPVPRDFLEAETDR